MNPEQAAVVAAPVGPLAVLAGAGTGKTHTLVERVRALVEAGAAPRRVLVVTFSKDACRELVARCERAGLQGVDVATWHSLAWRILREDETRFASWEVDSKGRGARLLSDACGPKGVGWDGADLAGMRKLLSLAGANLWSPDDFGARAATFKLFGAEARLALEAWQTFARLCDEARCLTFDRMLVEAVRHLQADEAAREWWGARWDHLLQDEAQDANVGQKTAAELLARGHRSYMIVGDPSQAIYAFRGSSPGHLLAFAAEWNAPTIALRRNYRCGAVIINAANAVIAPARERLPDELIAERGVEGRLDVVEADSPDDEARELAEHVAREHEAGARWSDFAVLWRTNAQSRAVEEAFLRRGIPHVIIGGQPFFERREVRGLLAYLRVAAAGSDAREADVRDCINTPNRFLGREFVGSVLNNRFHGESWADAVRQASEQARVWSKQKLAARQWTTLIEEVSRGIALAQTPAALLSHVADRTGYVEWLKREDGDGDEGEGRAGSIDELIACASRFKTCAQLFAFADQAEQVRREPTGDRVTCCSIHRSKGLEWPRVWAIGWTDGSLPHAKGDPDEERRLAYVAITRARDELTLSWWRARGDDAKEPSPFLFDAGLLKRPVGKAAA